MLQRDTPLLLIIPPFNLHREEKRVFKNQRHLLGTRNSPRIVPEDAPDAPVTIVTSPTSRAVMTFIFRMYSKGGHLCSAPGTVTGTKRREKKRKESQMLTGQRRVDGWELNLDSSRPSST